ncbi:MAG: hypothetical protein ACK559_02860, partial [bacterium]
MTFSHGGLLAMRPSAGQTANPGRAQRPGATSGLGTDGSSSNTVRSQSSSQRMLRTRTSMRAPRTSASAAALSAAGHRRATEPGRASRLPITVRPPSSRGSIRRPLVQSTRSTVRTPARGAAANARSAGSRSP